jgi:hypothetical protein
MEKLAGVLITMLFLAACRSAPPEVQTWSEYHTWSEYMAEVQRMDARQLLLARESAVRQFEEQPDDSNRLRAAYVLSRAPASPQQLTESRRLLADMAAESELTPLRNLLDGEIRRFMEVQDAESRVLELRTQIDELQSRLAVLQEQLNTLKNIETEMIENQQQSDEVHP